MVVVHYCTPRSEFSDKNEVGNAWEDGGFIFLDEGEVAVAGFVVEATRLACE